MVIVCILFNSGNAFIEARKYEQIATPTYDSIDTAMKSSFAFDSDSEGFASHHSRLKRDIKPETLNRIIPSAVTHVSNTTMVELLHDLGTNSTRRSNIGDRSNRTAKKNMSQVEVVRVTRSVYNTIKAQDSAMGDMANLGKEAPDDLMTAAGYKSKKYILVKKKPKHKKIKMEVFEPKMKYKKIKMKIPIKTLKKKKVKGYLVKKEKHHHH